jgi:predicted ATPase
MTRRARLTNLVASLASFVGREAVLDAVDACFRRGERLVTLLGPPGMGKTRAATGYAELRGAPFLAEGGVWFCDLSLARDVADLCAAVARTLGVRLSVELEGDAAAEFVGQELAELGPVLLVLDNFEQLSRDAAARVARWCSAAPDACVLVTSRERLGVPGERVIDLPPLELASAVALFHERARSMGATRWADDDAEAMVRELEGIPLAIELAAARTRVLGPRDLLARLPKRLDVLADGSRAGESRRHATLRAAIDGSWSALSPWERSALAQLSVFAGDITVEAAEGVLDLSAHEGVPPVLDVLGALCDKSLLRAATRDGARHFSMYVSIREYAAEQALATGEMSAAVSRHRRHHLAAAAPAFEAFIRTGSAEPRARLTDAKENLLAVYRRLRQAPREEAGRDADLARAVLYLEPLLATESPFDELLAMLESGLEAARRAGDAVLEARLLLRRGDAFGIRGESRACIADMDAARERARACGDLATEIEALVLSGARYRQQGRFDQALAAGEQAFALLASADCPRVHGENCAVMGLLMAELGRRDESRRFNLEARARLRALGNRWSEGLALANLAQLDQAEGAYERAAVGYDAALDAFRGFGDRRYEGRYLGYRAGLDLERGDLDAARERYGAALERITALRMRHHEGLFRACLGALEATAGRPAEAARELDLADALLAGVEAPTFVCAAKVHRCHLDLLWNGPDAARARIRDAEPLVASSEDVRFAVRLLDRALARSPSRAPAQSSVAPSLVVSDDGAWFEVDGAGRVDIGRRGALRRILIALARRHGEAPGERLAADALLEAGWPGERVLPEAGATRVRVALSTLRRMGLAKLLLTRDDGYLLDPRSSVRVGGDV